MLISCAGWYLATFSWSMKKDNFDQMVWSEYNYVSSASMLINFSIIINGLALKLL